MVNLIKFFPKTVIVPPGNDCAGIRPIVLPFVLALETTVTELLILTETSLADCEKMMYVLQIPSGILEFRTKMTS